MLSSRMELDVRGGMEEAFGHLRDHRPKRIAPYFGILLVQERDGPDAMDVGRKFRD
jgi:hypothetical protein